MTLSIFSFFFDLLDAGWRLLGWIVRVCFDLLGAALNFGASVLSGIAGLALSPFTWCMDRVWDSANSLNLGALFAVVLWVLLIACAAFAVLAVGNNVYRKYRSRAPRL